MTVTNTQSFSSSIIGSIERSINTQIAEIVNEEASKAAVAVQERVRAFIPKVAGQVLKTITMSHDERSDLTITCTFKEEKA